MNNIMVRMATTIFFCVVLAAGLMLLAAGSQRKVDFCHSMRMQYVSTQCVSGSSYVVCEQSTYDGARIVSQEFAFPKRDGGCVQ